VLEREIKLVVTPSFRLPALGDRFESVEAVPAEPRRLSATYFDTDDLRLARWGASLRRRTEEGWTVKLPVGANGQLLTRQELTFPGPAGHPPEAAVNAGAPTSARLRCDRRRACGPCAAAPSCGIPRVGSSPSSSRTRSRSWTAAGSPCGSASSRSRRPGIRPRACSARSRRGFARRAPAHRRPRRRSLARWGHSQAAPPTAWSRRSHPAPPPATSSVWRSPPRCCG
jgi:CYTH domain